MEELIKFASKTLNMDEGQVAELVKTEEGELKPNALALLLDKDKERIATRKTKEAEIAESNFSRGRSESMSKFEKEVKTTFGLDSDSKGLDLINAVIETKVKSTGTKEITPDDVKKSSTYIDAINTMKETHQGEIQTINNNHTGVIESYKKKETYKTISDAADVIVNTLNPVFSTNPTTAQNQRKQIHKELQSLSFNLNEDGKIVPLNAEGKALEDGHGHPIGFDSVVKNVTTGLFDLNASKKKSSGGDDGAGGGEEGEGATQWSGTAPKNEKEYMSMVANATSREDRKAITEAWDKVNA